MMVKKLLFNKFLNLLFITVLSWGAVNAQCNYTLEMNDSYGDGWNGNKMDVLVNGTIVLNNVTLSSGSQGTLNFSVNTGDNITTNWDGGGNDPNETSYRILDGNGTQVGNGAQSSITTAIVASCPTCPVPTSPTVSNITAYTVDIGFTCTSCTGSYIVEYSTVNNFTPGTGATAGSASSSVVTGTSTTIALTGLSSNTKYYYVIRQSCGGGDFSTNTSQRSFTTNLSCGDTFTDTGGSGGHYGNGENTVWTICPNNAGDMIQVNFSSFATESGYDYLYIYNGNSTSSPQIGSRYHGSNSPGTILANNSSGCLTFRFTSDGGGTRAGWVASISCISCVAPINTSNSAITPYTADVNFDCINCTGQYIIEYSTTNNFTRGTGSTAGSSASTVVSSTDTTETLNGLSPATTYYYVVRQSCGGGDFSTNTAQASFTTDVTCPAPTSPTVSNITPYTANVEFTCTGCTSSGYIVEYSTVNNFTPGTGTTAGSASSTIAGGTSSPVALSGLSQNTTYYYVIRRNCGGGDISANTTQASFTTAISCPVPTSPTVSNITPYTADIGFTCASCTGSYIVEYSTVNNFTPGTGATAGSASSSVVTGTNTTINLSSLLADTRYYYVIRRNCGSVDGFSVNTSQRNFRTAIACPAPTSPTVSNIGKRSADIGFTCASCTGSYIVEYSTTSGFTPGTGATAGSASSSVVTGTNTTIALTGLSSNTKYYYVIRQNCTGANDGFSTNTSQRSFTTKLNCGDTFTDTGGSGANYGNDENIVWTICPDSVGDMIEVNFSSFSTESGSDYLYIINGNSTSSPQIGRYHGSNSPGTVLASNTSGCLTFRFTSDYSITRSGWVASVSCISCVAPINTSNSAITPYTADVNFDCINCTGQYIIEYSTTNNFTAGTGSTAGSPASTVVSSTDTTETLNGLSPATTYYYVVRQSCGGGDFSANTAQANFTTDVTCPAPTSPTTSVITATSANIGATCASCTGSYIVEYSTTSGFTPGTGATAGAGTVVTGTSLPVALSGLSASTTYYYVVRQDCSGASNGFSTNTPEASFTTACGIVNTFPYTENFDALTANNGSLSGGCQSSDNITNCWSNNNANTNNWVARSNSTGSSDTGPSADHTTGSTNYVFLESSSCYGNTSYLHSPIYDFTALSSPKIKFWNHMYGNNMGTLDLEISSDGGTTWTSIWSLSGNQGNNWVEITIDLVSYAGQSNIQFRFKGTTGSSYRSDIAIDDVLIEEKPCDPPSNLNAVAEYNNANLSWTAGTNETSWNIEWGTTGFTQGNGTTITGTSTNPYNLTGLVETTTYDYYVQADCGSSRGSSTWTGPFTFTTKTNLNPVLLSDCAGTCIDLVSATGNAPYLLLDSNQYAVKNGKIQKHTITNNYSSAINAYQVELTIPYDNDMKADFGDLRFYDAFGNTLSYYIKNHTASTSAQIFVKMDLAIGTNTMYMTYGNSALNSLSNGKATMEVFEDMSTAPTGAILGNRIPTHTYYDATNQYVTLTTAYNSTWGALEYSYDFAGGFIADFEMWAGNGTGADGIYIYAYNTSTPSTESDNSSGYKMMYSNYQNKAQSFWNTGQIGSATISSNLDDGNWHTGKVVLDSSHMYMFFDGTQVLSYTDIARNYTGNKFGIAARTGGLNNEHRVRNFVMRKYVGTAVSVSLGTEETPTLCGYSAGTYNVTVADATGGKNIVNNIKVADYTADDSNTNGILEKVCHTGDWVYYGDLSTEKFAMGVLWNDFANTNDRSINNAAMENAIVNLIDSGTSNTPIENSMAGQQGVFLIDRYWDINLNGATLSSGVPVNVRFFIDTAEKTAALNAATTFQAGTTGGQIMPFTCFKKIGGAFNPTTDLQNGAFNITSLRWSEPTVNTGIIDAITYYELDSIPSFSGGGAGYTVTGCLAPSNLSATITSATSATLNWTAGASETAWQIEYDTAGFTHGNGIIANTTSNSHPLTGLSANTNYTFYVRAHCSAASSSIWVGPYHFTTNTCTVNGTDTKTECVSYTWINGVTYTTNNTTAKDTLIGAGINGCDSIVTLNLTINNPVTGVDTKVECEQYTWIDGNTYIVNNTTATHTIAGGAANGCDSTVTLNLTIKDIARKTDTIETCNSHTWINGTTYTTSTTGITHTIAGGAANGCDSIVVLNLTITGAVPGTDNITTCNSHTWIDGNTYTTSNTTATHLLAGAAVDGCDSLVTLNLTITGAVPGTDNITTCNSHTWIDGNTYTASNTTATHLLAGAAVGGCDSLVTLNLTINTPATSIDTKTECVSYTWIDGNTYTASNNTATHTISGGAANSCDSIITLNLTINTPATSTDTKEVCENSYTWIDGNTYTANNNTATYTITGGAANSCDSIITLNLTINALNKTLALNSGILTANESNADSYVWINCTDNNSVIAGANGVSYTPSNTGNYAVVVSKGSCSDTTECMNVIVTGIEELNTLLWSVRPNPTEGKITISTEERDVLVQIYSLEGKIIYTKQLENFIEDIDLSKVTKGIYLVNLSSSKGSQTQKLIIK